MRSRRLSHPGRLIGLALLTLGMGMAMAPAAEAQIRRANVSRQNVAAKARQQAAAQARQRAMAQARSRAAAQARERAASQARQRAQQQARQQAQQRAQQRAQQQAKERARQQQQAKARQRAEAQKRTREQQAARRRTEAQNKARQKSAQAGRTPARRPEPDKEARRKQFQEQLSSGAGRIRGNGPSRKPGARPSADIDLEAARNKAKQAFGERADLPNGSLRAGDRSGGDRDWSDLKSRLSDHGDLEDRWKEKREQLEEKIASGGSSIVDESSWHEDAQFGWSIDPGGNSGWYDDDDDDDYVEPGTEWDELPDGAEALDNLEGIFKVGERYAMKDDAGTGYRVIAPPPGALVDGPPAGAEEVEHDGSSYQYQAGTFYSQDDESGAWKVARPPLGAVVSAPPKGSERVARNGMDYRSYGGVLYRPVYRGNRIAWTVAHVDE